MALHQGIWLHSRAFGCTTGHSVALHNVFCMQDSLTYLRFDHYDLNNTRLRNVTVVCDRSYDPDIDRFLPLRFRVLDTYSYKSSLYSIASLQLAGSIELAANLSADAAPSLPAPYNKLTYSANLTITTAADLLPRGQSFMELSPLQEDTIMRKGAWVSWMHVLMA